MERAVLACMLLLCILGCSEPEKKEPVDFSEIKDNLESPTLNYAEDADRQDDQIFIKLDNTLKDWNIAQQAGDHANIQSTERVLGELTRGSFKRLVTALNKGTLQQQIIAAAALGFSDQAEAVDHLLEAERRGDLQLRQYAIMSIGHIGHPDTPLKRMFELLSSDPDERIRSVAVFVIIRVIDKEDSKGAVPYLLKALNDDSVNVRCHALIALSKAGDGECIKAIIATSLDHEHPKVRYNAVRALGKLGGEEVVRPLIKRLRDKSSPVRMAAAHVLAKITEEEELGEDIEKWEKWAAENL